MTITLDHHSSSHQTTQNNRVAILLMGYGEVENYEDFANYNEQALNLLTAKFAPIPHWMYPPFAKLLALFDFHEWHHQHDHFISPHNHIFEHQRAGIEQALKQQWGDQIKVFKAFNFCSPFLPSQVIKQIQEEGFEKLLIYPLLVVDSIFTSGIALEQVNKALLELNEKDHHWLKSLRYIPSFYNQKDYIHLLSDLVETKIQIELSKHYLPSQIGIVLMNHGCPHKARGFTSGIDESEVLYELVRKELINRYPLISIGWLNHDTPFIEWTQPDVTQACKNLIELGAKSLVLMPIGFATENHETLLDVEHIIEHFSTRFPDIHFIQMPCVNDHPQFLMSVAQWANPLIAELLADEGVMVNAQLTIDHTHQHSHTHGHHHHSH